MFTSTNNQAAIGQIIDSRYEVVSVLGQGSSGVVLHVLDIELDYQSFALKLIHPHLRSDQEVIRRLSAESILNRQLVHPNVVRLYEFVQTIEHTYLVMEYVEGCSLERFLSSCRNSRLGFLEGIYILEQVLKGLSAAHQIEIIHRDLKPGNILIDTNGKVKLTDFGIAQSIQTPQGLTRTGELLGTPLYMAPEQFRGEKCDARTDLYAFGVLAYEILTGGNPFIAPTVFEVMDRHKKVVISCEPLEEHSIPDWFQKVIAQCCEKEPNKRLVSSVQILSRLQEHNTSENRISGSTVGELVRNNYVRRELLPITIRHWIRCFYVIILMLIFLVLVFQDQNSRARIASDLIRIHRQYGTPISFPMQLIGYGDLKGYGLDDLVFAIKSDQERKAMILLTSGLDLRAPLADGKDVSTYLNLKHNELLDQYLRREINLTSRNGDGSTLLLRAVRERRSLASIQILKRDPDPTVQDFAGNNIIHLAVVGGDTELLKKIIDSLNGPQLLRTEYALNLAGEAPLHTAVMLRELAGVRVLINSGFAPNIRDRHGRTPLQRVLEGRRSPAGEELARLLLSSGGSLNVRDNQGRSIFQTCAEEWKEMTELKTAQSIHTLEAE